jgi:hypothetical protein
MFDLKSPSFGERIIDALAPFFTFGVLWRVAVLLFGIVQVYISVGMMLHGEYLTYEETKSGSGWVFTSGYTVLGVFIIYLGLRNWKGKDASDNHPEANDDRDRSGK